MSSKPPKRKLSAAKRRRVAHSRHVFSKAARILRTAKKTKPAKVLKVTALTRKKTAAKRTAVKHAQKPAKKHTSQATRKKIAANRRKTQPLVAKRVAVALRRKPRAAKALRPSAKASGKPLSRRASGIPSPRSLNPKIARKPPASISDILAAIGKKKPSLAPKSLPPAAAGAVPTGSAILEFGRLPESYRSKRVVAVARDPRWLYVSWDFTPGQLRIPQSRSLGGHLTVRVYRDSSSGELIKQLDVKADARFAFVPVPSGEISCVAELGYLTKKSRWVSLAFSRLASTPPDAIANEGKPAFATIPLQTSFAEIAASVGVQLGCGVPLVETILRHGRRRGKALVDEATPSISPPKWTSERARLLAQALSHGGVPEGVPGGSSSFGGEEILPLTVFDLARIKRKLGVFDELDFPSSTVADWSSGSFLCADK